MRRFKRIILILVLVIAAFFCGMGVVAHFSKGSEPPGVSQAPWTVVTDTRTYYAKQIQTNGGVVTIRNYWVEEGENFVHKSGEKVFDKRAYGSPQIIRRDNK